jgi:hypothetical protein
LDGWVANRLPKSDAVSLTCGNAADGGLQEKRLVAP